MITSIYHKIALSACIICFLEYRFQFLTIFTGKKDFSIILRNYKLFYRENMASLTAKMASMKATWSVDSDTFYGDFMVKLVRRYH